MRRHLTLLGLFTVFAAWVLATGVARAAVSSKRAARVAKIALRERGIHYRWGDSSPRSGFDCSGLVRWVYAHIGVQLPHSSFAQFGYGRRVPRRALRPGDLVFFDHLGHVGIYIGGGRFVHAPRSGTVVQTSRLAAYAGSYVGARRP